MLNKITRILYGTRTMAVVLVLYFVSMAVATFIENDYGTPTAKALIYNAKWFELLMFLLTVNFLGNISRFKLYKRSKWPVLLFHLAFILILTGAFVTRYFGYEGIMPIREGEQTNIMYSDKTYIIATVDDGQMQNTYNFPVLFGGLGTAHFDRSASFKAGKARDFRIIMRSFVPHAREVFEPDEQGELYLHLVEASIGAKKDVYLKEGETLLVGNMPFCFRKKMDAAVNFYMENDTLKLETPFPTKHMNMQTQEFIDVPEGSAPLVWKSLYDLGGGIRFVAMDVLRGKLKTVPAGKQKAQQFPYDALRLEVQCGGESKQVDVRGAKGTERKPVRLTVGGLNFRLQYGSKRIELPFFLRLRDFIMDRYPGTNSPSSYASEVTVIEPGKTFDYRIYMNHVLDYRGYRFYQSSYDPDEKGTILSVNHDYMGTLITYTGYFLMALGMFVSLFWNGTRFQKLSRKVGEISKKHLTVLMLFSGLFAFAQQQEGTGTLDQNTLSESHAGKFGHLWVQDVQGRVKPMNTYSLEILRKIYKKDRYRGKTADQVVLSAMLRPGFWARQKMIKVKKYALGNKLSGLLKVNDKGRTALVDYFTPDGKYILREYVDDAYRKKKALRTATDNEIINLDEKVNVWLSGLKGNMLNIYPKKGDPNHKWYNGYDEKAFVAQDTMVLSMHRMYMHELNRAMETGDYSKADEFLGYISQYQQSLGKDIIPPANKMKWEILYNKWNIFKLLLFYFMSIGFVLLVLAFIDLFSPGKKAVKVLYRLLAVLSIAGLLAHAAGLGMRWYVSGHAPWSNGYEAVVFVAFITVVAGLIFSYKKSKFILAVAVLFASFLLGIAHGSLMNPEITNLVPVLKSYWLMIHVAVITASYGFLGLSALLAMIVLVIYLLRNSSNKKRFDHSIQELTYVNEMSMTVGLYMLSLGTFLGGVWANESWGRYWSWDPKEVWSLISMMVYVLILHMRIVPGLRGKFAFNTASVWSLGTLIMTFFGVNFYLSGMHSYAAGDPVPIPVWIPVSTAALLIFNIIAYIKYKRVER